MRLPTEWKALSWYCKENSLRPLMSVYPMARFESKTGEITERNVHNLVADYKKAKALIAAEKRREAKFKEKI